MSYNDWITRELSQIVDYQVDNRGRNPEEYLEKSIYPVVDNFMIKNQKYPNLNEANRYIDSKTFDNFLRGYVKKGDVLITLVGNGIGNLTTVPTDKCAIIQNTLGLRCNAYMINDFLYYTLLFHQERIRKFDRGSSQPSIRKTDLLSMKIQVPPINEQKAIANILSSLDDKIEINNKINKNLEELAQTIYKRWFVDFEFPNEDGDPYKSSGGKMVKSELGLIPEGWQVITLDSTVSRIDNRGKTPPLESEVKAFPIIDVKALSGDGPIIDYKNCTKFVNRETYQSWFRNGHPVKNDILISTVGSLAEMKMFLDNKGCIAQNVVALRSNNLDPYFLYYLLNNIKTDLTSYNIGSVQPSIKVTHIIQHKIIKPSTIISYRFSKLARETINMHLRKSNENDNLIELRDQLLPKLMSGEIKVPIKN